MKRQSTFFLFLFAFLPTWATNYYVDSQQGSDRNNGKSILSPWKSIEKVNKQVFKPGDSLFFACNGVWFDHLKPQGSGNKKQPIVLSSYGSGNKPLLIGKGTVQDAVIALYNQSFWEISDLEIIHDAPEAGDRRGVEVKAANAGVIEHIHLKNLHIHHIKGIPGDGDKPKRTAGIFIAVTDNKEVPTRFHDILIEGCLIHDADNQGLALQHEKFRDYPGEGNWDDCKFTQVIIRNNVIHHISKNAMIVRMTEGGLVENNVCFETAIKTQGNTMFSRNVSTTTFQKNEGFRNRAHAHDGCMYDPDLRSLETYWQYSYSHDNAHGLVWMCTEEKDKVFVRNNISQNDKGFLVYFNYAYDYAEVSNNIFYVGKTVSPHLIREMHHKKHGPTYFTNNTIINHSDNLVFEYKPETRIKRGINIDNRKLSGNTYLHKPLVNPRQIEMGKAEIQAGQPSYLKFHRSFIKRDEIDTLTGYQAELFAAQPVKDVVVAYVNKIPVYRFEMEREIRRLRALLIAEHKTEPSMKQYREKAMPSLIALKVQEQKMLQNKLPEGKAVPAIEQLREKENTFRRNNGNNKELIVVGPTYFSTDAFWDYFFANAVESLKKSMLDKELPYTEEELIAHRLTGDLDRTTPKWASQELSYCRSAVIRSLVDEKYAAWLAKAVEEAEVVVMEQ